MDEAACFAALAELRGRWGGMVDPTDPGDREDPAARAGLVGKRFVLFLGPGHRREMTFLEDGRIGEGATGVHCVWGIEELDGRAGLWLGAPGGRELVFRERRGGGWVGGRKVWTAAQMAGERYFRWCAEICEAPRFHRAQWELVFVLDELERRGMLGAGVRGLCVGTRVGVLPLVMAGYGCEVELAGGASIAALREAACPAIKDTRPLPGAMARGLAELERGHEGVSSAGNGGGGYDFVVLMEARTDARPDGWLRWLREGGLLIQTGDFRPGPRGMRARSGAWDRKGIDDLLKRLAEAGGEFEFDEDTGNEEMDWLIDREPYSHDPHLKVAVGDGVVTSVGICLGHRFEGVRSEGAGHSWGNLPAFRRPGLLLSCGRGLRLPEPVGLLPKSES